MVAIFEVGIGSVVDEQLHDFIALLVVDEDGREVEGGLAGLSFETIDDDGVIVSQEIVDFVDGAGFRDRYQHLMEIIKSLTTSYVASFLLIY